MELTASHALQIAILAGTAISGYAVVRATVQRLKEDFAAHIKNYENTREKFDSRLDNAEQERGKIANQVLTLKGINSPTELKSLHRELEGLQREMKWLTKSQDRLDRMHNGSHPPVESK
tara:strand:+ start:2694 stop:3050 length:357 start_codon:yes stop_codon:yes gene_type:complete